MVRARHTASVVEKSALAIGVAGATLVAASLIGGAVSVAAGVNAWSTAWTAEATLAAPWPMLVVQSAATVAAAQKRRRLAAVGSALLGLSAALAGVSGFFDGQLARSDLGSAFVTAQVAYVVVAWVTVGCAGYRLRALRRPEPRSAARRPR